MKRKATCLRPLSNTRSVLQKNGQEVPSCPICNKSLWTDPAFSSMHIEQCLSKSSSSNSTFNERYPSTSGDVVSLLSDEEEENLPATPENALASLNAEVQKQQQTRRELWSQNAYIDQAISLGTSGDKVDDKSSSSTIVAVENPTAGTTATKRSIHSSSTQPLQSTLPLQITTFGLAATSNSSSAFCLSQISIHTIPTLPGVFIIQNFLAEEEELAIVRMLDGDVRTPWKPSSFNGQCKNKVYGVRTQFGLPREERLVRENDVNKGEFDIPLYIRQFAERTFPSSSSSLLVADGIASGACDNEQHIISGLFALPCELAEFDPNDCNANSYLKSRGDFLKLHYDDRALSGPLLLNMSMLSDSYMTYAKPNYPLIKQHGFNTNTIITYDNKRFFHDVQKVLLPRRALQIVSGDARWQYMHSICPDDILGERRVSLTYRQSGAKKEGVRRPARGQEGVLGFFNIS